MKRINFTSILLVVVLLLFISVGKAKAQTALKLVLGNPSNAVADINTPDNYLVIHNGFVLSYNRERGGANWVTWHLSASDISTAERTNAFALRLTVSVSTKRNEKFL